VKYIEKKKQKYTQPKFKVIKPKMNFDWENNDNYKDKEVDSKLQAKTNLFKKKLKPISKNINETDSVKDELITQSINNSIQNPLIDQNDQPIRESNYPARFKSSVMKIKVPITHEKYKAEIVPETSNILD
jgi:hypothetical protein